MVNIWALIAAAGIPSAVTGLCVWLLQRGAAKREAKAEQRDKARRENELLTIKGIGAAIALGEATATAIKKGHCNGEVDAALKYAREIKHEQKNFLAKQAVDNNY